MKVLLMLSMTGQKRNDIETIDYYEAVRIAYTESEYMRKYFDSPKGITT